MVYGAFKSQLGEYCGWFGFCLGNFEGNAAAHDARNLSPSGLLWLKNSHAEARVGKYAGLLADSHPFRI